MTRLTPAALRPRASAFRREARSVGLHSKAFRDLEPDPLVAIALQAVSIWGGLPAKTSRDQVAVTPRRDGRRGPGARGHKPRTKMRLAACATAT